MFDLILPHILGGTAFTCILPCGQRDRPIRLKKVKVCDLTLQHILGGTKIHARLPMAKEKTVKVLDLNIAHKYQA